MSIIKEFREFAIKGNVVDLAVAVVLGAAFGKMISAFTDSIIAPLLALIVGKVDIAHVKVTIASTVFPIGILLQAVIDFILIAWVLFAIIKAINIMKRSKETAAEESATSKYTLTEQLLMDIKNNLSNGYTQKTDINV